MSHQHTDDEANQEKQDVSIRHGTAGGESRVKVDVVADDHLHGAPVPNPNSRAKADLGEPYVQIPRPNNPRDAVDAINVWARYLHHWGVRVDHEFHDLYSKLKAAGTPTTHAAGTPTTHLDPPPEPFK